MNDAESRERRALFVQTATLVALAGLAAGCAGDREREPATVPHPVPLPPLVVEDGPVPLVEHRSARDSLLVRERGGRDELTLLFHRGRGVSRDAAGTAYVPDAGASRAGPLRFRA